MNARARGSETTTQPCCLNPPRFGWLVLDHVAFGVRLSFLIALVAFASFTFAALRHSLWTPTFEPLLFPLSVVITVLGVGMLALVSLTKKPLDREAARPVTRRCFDEAARRIAQGESVNVVPRSANLEQLGLKARRVRRPRLRLCREGLSIEGEHSPRGRGEVWILWQAVRSVDWSLRGVELDLLEGRCTIETARLPRGLPALDHYPVLSQRVHGATITLLSYNQHLAELLLRLREASAEGGAGEVDQGPARDAPASWAPTLESPACAASDTVEIPIKPWHALDLTTVEVPAVLLGAKRRS